MLLAATAGSSASAEAQSLMKRFTPVSEQLALNPNPNDWLMWRRYLQELGLQPARSDQQGKYRTAAAFLTDHPGTGQSRSGAARA
jgi:hypothetical protein